MSTGAIHGPAPSGGEPVDLVLKASAARTAGDLVTIAFNSDGEWVDESIADDAVIHWYAVALNNVASGAYGSYRVKGKCTLTVPSASYTKGHGLKVHNGAIATIGGALTSLAGEAINAFGVNSSASGTLTSVQITLHGHPCTATT